MIQTRTAKFRVGQIVRERNSLFRGVIFDVDFEFNRPEAIPEEEISEDERLSEDQPFYHLLVEDPEWEYSAYYSEQNLLPDDSNKPVRHSKIAEIFVKERAGGYRLRHLPLN